MNERRKKRSCVLILLAVYAVMLAFNLMTPMAGDDFAHFYGRDGNHIGTAKAILENLAYLRENVNGRVLAHFCVYLMQIPPRFVFSLLNAAVLPLLLILMLRLLPSDCSDRGLWALVGGMLLWLFSPGFGEVFLWLTGSCNYGWSLPLLLLSLSPFIRACTGRGEGGARELLLIPLAFCCGAFNEVAAIALLAAALLLFILAWLRKGRLPWRLLALLLAGVLGFALLLLAPATLSTRTGDLSVQALFLSLKRLVARVKEHYLLLYLLYALLFAQTWGSGKDRWLPLTSLALVAAGLASSLSLAAGSYLVNRCFAPASLLTVLACLLLMAGLRSRERGRWTASIAAVLTVLFLFSFASGAGDILSLFRQGRAREETIRAAREAGETSVVLPPLLTSTHYAEIAWEGLEESPDGWYNDLLAKYYGFEKVYGALPEEDA